MRDVCNNSLTTIVNTHMIIRPNKEHARISTEQMEEESIWAVWTTIDYNSH